MEKKESRKAENMKNQNFEAKKMRPSSNSKKMRDKSLPWWVELLFVQIGLPDKFLIKILKYKRNFKDSITINKKYIFTFLIFFSSLIYLYPVVKYSKTKLECESIARNYITQNKNLVKFRRSKLRMLATNFCNGGNEIYEIQNIEK